MFDAAHLLTLRASSHPNLPLAVVEYLTAELKVSHKYVVLDVLTDTGKTSRLLSKHVHLVCAHTPQAEAVEYLREQLAHLSNATVCYSNDYALDLDDDSFDFAIVGQAFTQSDAGALSQELERLLRLNSFVVVVAHRLHINSPFSDAYQQLLNQLKIQDEYTIEPTEENLTKFFKAGYECRTFPNQLRLTEEQLINYCFTNHYNQPTDEATRKIMRRALHLLFAQHQQNGEIVLDFDTNVYVGLYNKFVPAISLQKGLFFNALRPFAFGFYVLVKLNVYFWRFLYRLRYLKKNSS